MTDPDVPARDDGPPPASQGRHIAFTVVTLLLAAGALGGLFGIGIVIGWWDTDEGGIHRVHDIGFGVLYGVLLCVAFVALARRPETRPAAYFQVVAVALAAAVAGLVSADANYLILALAVGAGAAILLALHPDRDVLLHPRPDPDAVLGGFVLVAAFPLLWLAWTMARLQRVGPSADPHVSMDHWANMAAMALGLLFVGAIAATRIRGWRLSAWCAGLGAAGYGLASIVFHRFPGSDLRYPGSEGVGWGLLALLGGLAFIAVSEVEARRPPAAA